MLDADMAEMDGATKGTESREGLRAAPVGKYVWLGSSPGPNIRGE